MSLLDNTNLVAIDRQLEQGDLVRGDELRRDWSTAELGVLLRTPRHALTGLHNRDLIVATLGLNGDNIVTAELIETEGA